MAYVGETEISNLEKYNSSMAKSLIDKIFFMDKIDDQVKFVVDYGCADGTLVRFLASIFPDLVFIGYDINLDMITLANEKGKHLSNAIFTTDLDSLKVKHPDFDYSRAVLNLSSLIHEIYSYCSGAEIENFWNFVNSSGFRYVITRDMCLDYTAHRAALKEDLIKVKKHYINDEHLSEFEKIHGSIDDNYNLIHFLLKYRYHENWDREVKENYLPLCVEDIAKRISDDYELIYMDHYVLPYLARTVMDDFGIVLKDYTHAKFIYRNRNV